jgi:WD40 repeat protein
MIDHYQIGGSLAVDAPCYVSRQADEELLEYLKNGDFCYVFNSRQMGKSSLLVRTSKILREKGWQTATIDMTAMGSEMITPEQWYWGMISRLWRTFKLNKYINFTEWIEEKNSISIIDRLGLFIEEILLKYLPDTSIAIFVDEIDSVLSLNFPVDDFFAFIRFCYNQRAVNPAYQRLTFALFGVVTPTDLVKDKKRTPFNIGRAINLTGFQFAEAKILMESFPPAISQPTIILQEIINWTDGQPFLTQKICRLVAQSNQTENTEMRTMMPRVWVASLIQKYIIHNWESQDQPEHLRTIRDRLNYDQQRKGRLLGIYQQILQQKFVGYDDSREHTELILSGLVVKYEGNLRVKNRIYAEVFNLEWVSQQLESLRPYSQTFTAWILSGQTDHSRLLRGQALKDALAWSQGKSLSDLDYQFMAASTEIDRQEIQQKLELDRAKAVEVQLTEQEKRLCQEQANSKLQKLLLILLGTAFALVSTSSLIAIREYRLARISEIQALISSSRGLFASHYQLESMISAVEAKQKLKKLSWHDQAMVENTETVLNQTIYSNNEFNRLIGHQGSVLTVDISPDDQLIVTGSNDKTARIWSKQGLLLQTLKHFATVHRVVFSADSQKVISASLDGTINIWQVNGELIKTIPAHNAPVWGIAVSPDGQYIASASGDRTVKLWTIAGELVTTFTGHAKGVWNVSFSPDSQMIVSGGTDHQVKLWSIQGDLLHNLLGHKGAVWDVAFCNDQSFVSVSSDKTIRIWNINGKSLRMIKTDHPVLGTDCQNGFMITSGKNNIAKVWQTDGTFIRDLKQHRAIVREVALNSNGLIAISASDDGTAKMWQRNKYLLRPIYAHPDTIWYVATNRKYPLFASVSADNTLKLWEEDGGKLKQIITLPQVSFRSVNFSTDGRFMVTGNDKSAVQIWDLGEILGDDLKLLKTLTGHQAAVYAVGISPDQSAIASGADDKTIKLWNMQGELLKSFIAHSERIWQLAFSPDGKILASASEDGTVKLWQKDGKLITTLKHDGPVWGLVFHPEKNIIITTSRDNTLNFWQFDGKLEKSIMGESGGLTRVAISPDGNIIATGGVDNTVKLWDNSGKLLRTLSGHQGMVISLAFTANGKSIISGADDGLLMMWDLPQILSLNNLHYACEWMQDYLQHNIEVKPEQKILCDGIQK